MGGGRVFGDTFFGLRSEQNMKEERWSLKSKEGELWSDSGEFHSILKLKTKEPSC